MFCSPIIALDRLKFQNQGMTNLIISIALEEDDEVRQVNEVHQVNGFHF